MAPTLYIFHGSPPVRAVLVTAKALNVDLDLKVTHDIQTPEFLKMNPQHTVPTFIEGDKILCDSHAIITYLVQKYAKDDSLYPKDAYKRALVDQRLHFDSGTLFPLMRTVVKAAMQKEIKQIPQKYIEEYQEAYGFLEKFLQGHEWVADDSLSIADFSCYTTLTTLDCIEPLDFEVYPNISGWIERIQALSNFADDAEEIQAFEDFYHSQFL